MEDQAAGPFQGTMIACALAAMPTRSRHSPKPRTRAKVDAVDFLAAARRCEVASLRHLLEAGRLVLCIGGLIHCLQRERGASNLYLGSGGQCYGEPLVVYQEQAQAAEAELHERLSDWLNPEECRAAGARLFARIAVVLQGLSGLPALRQEVRTCVIEVQTAMGRFNDVVRGLLAVVFEAADSAADPEISRALVALFNFMQGKELAGQERAIGAAGFSRGGFDDTLKQALMHRIDAQERCFQVFAEFCHGEALSAWQQTLTAPHTAEVERLRRIACTQQVPASGGVELAKIWFDQTTHRIDAMKTVEEGLEAHLERLCESRIETVNAEMQAAHGETTELDQARLDSSEPYAVFYGEPRESTTGGDLVSAGASPPLGRSVMELVHKQSRRLQAMEDELQAARAALAERKVIERAKALLMQHRNLSEDEAHRFLRQTAMNQNRRLVEVAEAVVSMADVLG
jgi:hypothetical protein